jgi:xanthine dehydrogenase YagS FAD-binding subunit
MNPFDYSAPTDADAALADLVRPAPGLAAAPARRYLAGGTNLIDLMKEGVMRPTGLVDVNRLPWADIAETGDGGLLLGALARNAETAEHPLVRERYPLLRSAILAGASPQIRNMASNGGNLLQRTRCVYFYDAGVPCNKHTPGSGCPARRGIARQHAIFGASEHCIATHPSDMCVALAALDAVVHLRTAAGARTLPFAELHRLPGDRPELDTTLGPDELITAIELPPAAPFAAHTCYLKVRERTSYAFALVSVAAMLDLDDDGRIRAARLAMGGVAHKPWRKAEAEALLEGRPAGDEAFGAAADCVMADARPVAGSGDAGHGNGYKLPMARRAIVRALQMAAAGITTNTGEDAARREGAPR